MAGSILSLRGWIARGGGMAGALLIILACGAGAQSLIATLPMVNQPEGVAVNPNTNRIYALNNESPYTLRVFNGSTNGIIADVSVGFKPQFVAVNPSTNRIYTTHYFLKQVTVVDGNTNTVIATVPLTGNPMGIDLNTSTNRIYVASFADASQGGTFAGVWTIDGNTNTVVTSLALGGTPSNVAVDSRLFARAYQGNGGYRRS